ncbi:MAG: molybdenum cofactor guanylyltransferase [Candidatus Marinimicrobia bacterium]|nr:molybdenum cofactor guanylyltransferase [Candidatus Neomarinimicrobiota bacterium]
MIQASAFILIGGKSERFGSPKWQAVIEGKSILDRTWDACIDFEHRFVIGKKKPEDLKIPFIQDELEIQAPINGLYTALKYTTTDWNLLLSCDLPLISNNILQKLWIARSHDTDAIVPLANDKAQGTCAFYHKKIFPFVESAIHNANYSLYSLIDKLDSINIKFGNDKRFWNMNTKKDYEEISRYVSIKRNR